MNSLAKDLSYGARMWQKRPRLTMMAIIGKTPGKIVVTSGKRKQDSGACQEIWLTLY